MDDGTEAEKEGHHDIYHTASIAAAEVVRSGEIASYQVGSVEDSSKNTSDGGTERDVGNLVGSAAAIATGGNDADSSDSDDERTGFFSSGASSRRTVDQDDACSSSNESVAFLNAQTIPTGYSEIEEAENASSYLLQTRSQHDDAGQYDDLPRHSTDRRTLEASEQHIFNNAYSTRYQPDTSIAQAYEDLIRQSRRLSSQLNDLHMKLLERQAESLQLRMSTVSCLMEFQTTTSSVQSAVRSLVEASRSSLDVEGTGQPPTSADSEWFPGSQSQPHQLQTPPTRRRPRNSGHTHDILSMSIHTIEEESSNDNDESSGLTGLNQIPSRRPSSSSDGSSPPADRWGEINPFSAPIMQSEWIQQRRRYVIDYDQTMLQLLHSSPKTSSRQLWSCKSFPQWSPCTMKQRLEKASTLLPSSILDSSSDDMHAWWMILQTRLFVNHRSYCKVSLFWPLSAEFSGDESTGRKYAIWTITT